MTPLSSVDGGIAPVASAKPKSVSVTVDVVPPHPRAGQPVDFVARIVVTPAGAARPALDGPVFQVTGPGIPSGARVAAACDEVGLCRASYSLASPGRVEVTFVAKTGAQQLHTARWIQVAGDATAPPPPPPSAADPLPGPAPSGSTGKWL